MSLSFELYAFKAGIGEQIIRSDDNGRLADANDSASYHMLKIRPINPDPSKMWFEIATNFLAHEQYGSNDFTREYSPPHQADPGQGYIRAFRIRLAGPDKDKYTVKYSVFNWHTGLDGQGNGSLSGPTQGIDGDWAGVWTETPGQHCWISRFQINLSQR